MKERFLTKSLFVRALACPRKLFYVGKPEYADNSVDDDFMESLAEGGIQVGALARCYFPGGVLVVELDKKIALARTAELLKRDRVTLFEAAIQHGDCFFRADILVKNADAFLHSGGFGMLAVKARSVDVTMNPQDVFRQEAAILKRKLEVVETVFLRPFEKDHAMIICRKP